MNDAELKEQKHDRMTAEQVAQWALDNKALSERAHYRLIRILERMPVHPAALGVLRREFDLPHPMAAWMGLFKGEFVRTAADQRCGGQPSVSLAKKQDDPSYWKEYRTVIPDGSEPPPRDRPQVVESAWMKLGLEGGDPGCVRAEIFRAFLIEKFSCDGVDMVQACSRFLKTAGMKFTDFFGGLTAKEIALQDWGSRFCVWVPVSATAMKVVAINPREHCRFMPLSNICRDELLRIVRVKVPERIDFTHLAEIYHVTRESIMSGYLTALGLTLRQEECPREDVSSKQVENSKDKGGLSIAVAGVKRLWGALLGRKGHCRSRYLRKWQSMLLNSTTQNANILCDDGRVVVGALINADEDYFTLKVGRETQMLPLEKVVEIKGVDRDIGGEMSEKKEVLDIHVGDSGKGRITSWKDREFGFVVSKSETYFFSRSNVEIPALRESLDSGRTGQLVSFVVVALPRGKYKYANVKITEWTENKSTFYSLARVALQQGNFADAKAYFMKVLDDPHDEHFEGALKDLAELLNRTDPNKAYALIERYRGLFPQETQQLSFERMEVGYLLRAKRYAEAAEKITKFLSKSDLDGSQREYYGQLLKQAEDQKEANEGSNEVAQDDAYLDLLMKQCDFHGLESEGIGCIEDLPEDGDENRQATLLRLQRILKSSWDVFCVDVPAAERKMFRDVEFSKEQLRFQLTDICLNDALGSAVPFYFSLRFYLWRKAQCLMFDHAGYSTPEVLAYIILVARLAARTRTVSRYWQTVLPLLLCHVIIGGDGEELRRIIEDEEYRNVLLEHFPLTSGTASRIHDVVMWLQLNAILPEFNGIFERLGIALPEKNDSYANWIDEIKSTCREISEEITPQSIEKARQSVEHMPGLPDNDRQRIECVRSFLEKCADYIHTDDYERRVRINREIQGEVLAFENNYVLRNITLPTIDAFYPIESAFSEAIANDCAKASVTTEIALSCDHAETSRYYVDNGMIELKIRVGLCNAKLPPISNIILKPLVDGACNAVAGAFFAGPLRHGSDHIFSVPLKVSDENCQKGCGSVDLNLEYERESDNRAKESRNFHLDFTLEDDEFEPIENPYLRYTQHPAKGRLFVGREKKLAEIAGVFGDMPGGQCYILYGQRRSGKTSMMDNLAHVLEKERFVYTRISAGTISGDDVLRKFVRSIASRVSADFSDDAVFDQLQSMEDPIGQLRNIRRYLRSTLGQRQMTWVVGIDEFTYFYDQYIKSNGELRNDILTFLRALKALLEEGFFHLLLIGQESVVQMQKEFPNELAIWRLNRLSYLAIDDIRKLADEQIRRRRDNGALESRYKGVAFQRLFDLTAGQPWFTQHFCSALVDYLNECQLSDVTEGVVDSVCKRLCVGDTKLPEEMFEPFVHLMDPSVDEDSVVQLYYYIAERTEKESDWVSLESLSRDDQLLVRILEKRGMVLLRDESVRLRMGLLAYWLRANPGRTKESFGDRA